MNYIKDNLKYLIERKKEPNYSSISLEEFVKEFDYATKYLSRLLKVRAFVMYLLLFKRAYFEEGQREIEIKLSDLGKNMLSDFGKPMSHDVVKRGVNDLVKMKIVNKNLSKPGQVNRYEVKLPSEIRKVRKLIQKESQIEEKISDNSKDDFYTASERRLKILKRDSYRCFYCLKELDESDYYLDHLRPLTKGGNNYRSNLVSACRSCNSSKNASNPKNFLLKNYRAALLTQKEFIRQNEKLIRLIEKNESLA